MYLRLGKDPLVYFFLRENLERFAAETYDVGRPWWFYLPTYLAEGLPLVAVPAARARAARRLRRRARSARRARFLAVWVALALVPLSLSRGKLDYYLLPLYPALSLLVARYLTAVAWRRADAGWARAIALLLSAAVALLALRPPRLPAEWLPGDAARAVLLAALVAGALGLAALALRPSPGRALVSFSLAVALPWLAIVTLFLPAFAVGQPNREMVADVARERTYRPDLRMAFCSDPTRVRRDVLLELRIAAVSECDLWSLAGSREPYLLLATPAQNASFRVDRRYRHIATYRYLPADTLTLSGLFGVAEPGEIMLGANFPTKDPVAKAKRKREYRQMLYREQGILP